MVLGGMADGAALKNTVGCEQRMGEAPWGAFSFYNTQPEAPY
jgi:hypothetical protein